MPEVVAALQPGKYKYKAKIEVEGESMDVKMSTDIREKKRRVVGHRRVRRHALMSMKDIATRQTKPSCLLKRSMKEAGTKVDLEFSEGRATGAVKTKGKKSAVDLPIGGPVFADGPGHAQVIACLPLADGYTASFRTFDVHKEKPRAMRLEVTGSEQIEVPAGAFDTFRVEVCPPADGRPRNARLPDSDLKKRPQSPSS